MGQAWRGGGPRQALLARALEGIEIRPLDEGLGRAAGALLARAGGIVVIDAALVPLATQLGRHVEHGMTSYRLSPATARSAKKRSDGDISSTTPFT